ncbi:MAG: hypothetical protein U1D96_08320 [Eubacteriales bacterium]|nr:ArsR family transcriptional regulator [Bacillota bacterium]MBV1728501.1 ArsR family transcriptional regulator [Desulforudis sp.]MDQ7789296.1 hypothetical protein [Clostridia bacterium]MDZ4043481.1 hypothetical protein [Eubacteriales bacterium]MBU4533091.1 ArsR family transcriptional regulator [Bacillota bacterium]
MQQSKVSYHLGVLKEAGLIIEEPRGKWSYYRLNRGEIQAYDSVGPSGGTHRDGFRLGYDRRDAGGSQPEY